MAVADLPTLASSPASFLVLYQLEVLKKQQEVLRNNLTANRIEVNKAPACFPKLLQKGEVNNYCLVWQDAAEILAQKGENINRAMMFFNQLQVGERWKRKKHGCMPLFFKLVLTGKAV